MKNLLISTVAAVALLTACGGGDDKAGAAGDSVKVGDVTVPGLKLVKGDPAKAKDALVALSLDTSGAGRVNFAGSSTDGADATFNDVEIGLEGQDNAITSGALTFKGLNMTEAGASFSQMTLTDMSFSPDGEEAEINVGSLQLTNPSPELAGWVSSLMGQGEPAEFPSFDKISFDGFNMSGLSLDASEIDELSAFKIDAIDVRQLSESGIGAILFDGINVEGMDDGQPVSFSLGSLGMTGVTETVMAIFSQVLEEGAGGASPDAISQNMASLISANPADPGYDSFTIDSMALDASGLKFDLPNMKATVTRDKQGRATRSTTKPFSFSLAADPLGEMGAQLAGPLGLMGYETLNMTAASDVKINPDNDTLSSDKVGNFLTLEDGFKLSGGGSMSGVSDFYKKLVAAGDNVDDESVMLDALSSMSLSGMELSFEDNSIIEKGFTLAAAMSGQDVEGMRAQAVAGVAFLPLAAGQAGIDPAIAAEVGGALSKFLNDSGTLTIKLAPKTPITAAAFSDPSTITKDSLGFTATTK